MSHSDFLYTVCIQYTGQCNIVESEIEQFILVGRVLGVIGFEEEFDNKTGNIIKREDLEDYEKLKAASEQENRKFKIAAM